MEIEHYFKVDDIYKDNVGYKFWRDLVNIAIKKGYYEYPVNLDDFYNCIFPKLLMHGTSPWTYTIYAIISSCIKNVFEDFHNFYIGKYEDGIINFIYGKRDIFNIDILDEYIRAICVYVFNGNDSGRLMALFVKYNGSYKLDDFRIFIEHAVVREPPFRDILRETIYFQKNPWSYEYLRNLEDATKRLNMITIDSDEKDIDNVIDIAMKQLRNTLKETEKGHPNTIMRNQYSRKVIRDFVIFEQKIYLAEEKEKFYKMSSEILKETNPEITKRKIAEIEKHWNDLGL